MAHSNLILKMNTSVLQCSTTMTFPISLKVISHSIKNLQLRMLLKCHIDRIITNGFPKSSDVRWVDLLCNTSGTSLPKKVAFLHFQMSSNIKWTHLNFLTNLNQGTG